MRTPSRQTSAYFQSDRGSWYRGLFLNVLLSLICSTVLLPFSGIKLGQFNCFYIVFPHAKCESLVNNLLTNNQQFARILLEDIM